MSSRKSRSKKIKSRVYEPDTPSWLDRILKEVEKTFTPLAKDLEKVERAMPGMYKPCQPTATAKSVAVINFLMAAFGLCFSIVNAIFMSNLDDECKDGYDKSERIYLFAGSIIVAVLFGILAITATYHLKQAFQ